MLFWRISIGFFSHFSLLTPVGNRCAVYRRLTVMTLTDSFNFFSQFSVWPQTVSSRFHYSIYPITFSVGNADEWKKLFKPCAAQRLFLPVGSCCLMFFFFICLCFPSHHNDCNQVFLLISGYPEGRGLAVVRGHRCSVSPPYGWHLEVSESFQQYSASCHGPRARDPQDRLV